MVYSTGPIWPDDSSNLAGSYDPCCLPYKTPLGQNGLVGTFYAPLTNKQLMIT